MNPEQIILSGVASLIFIFVLLSLPCVYWWLKVSRVDSTIGFSRLLFMTVRKTNKRNVLTAYMNARKNNIDMDIDAAESHYFAGGDINRIVNALILARQNNIDLVFNRAAAIDLAGRDVLEAVIEASKTIDLEYPENNQTIEFISNNKDTKPHLSFSLKVKLNLDRLVGGEEKDVLFPRIEKIVSDYLLKIDETLNLFDIRKKILQKGIDAGTKYHLVDVIIKKH